MADDRSPLNYNFNFACSGKQDNNTDNPPSVHNNTCKKINTTNNGTFSNCESKKKNLWGSKSRTIESSEPGGVFGGNNTSIISNIINNASGAGDCIFTEGHGTAIGTNSGSSNAKKNNNCLGTGGRGCGSIAGIRNGTQCNNNSSAPSPCKQGTSSNKAAPSSGGGSNSLHYASSPLSQVMALRGNNIYIYIYLHIYYTYTVFYINIFGII